MHGAAAVNQGKEVPLVAPLELYRWWICLNSTGISAAAAGAGRGSGKHLRVWSTSCAVWDRAREMDMIGMTCQDAKIEINVQSNEDAGVTCVEVQTDEDKSREITPKRSPTPAGIIVGLDLQYG
jgi:hypothetical protein